MNGSGCKNCPVKQCETLNYRGSTCAAQRAEYGLGDPMTIADRIRAKDDEELAKEFEGFYVAGLELASGQKIPEETREVLLQVLLEQIQKPAEGEKNEGIYSRENIR